MADAPEIKVKLSAEDTGVAAAIKDLGSQLKNLKKTQDETASSSLNLAKAFQGIAVGAAALSVIEFGKSVFDSATEIARAAQITGASAKTLGVFHKAASDLGISGEVIDKSFVKLSRSILSFQQGNSQAAQAFAQLHISLKNLAGLNTDEKIKLVTDRLGGMTAGTNRAALAQQLLGRVGAEALPVLQTLAGEGFARVQAEAEKMGLLFDDQTAGSILAMQKQLADLKDEAAGAATQFEVGLIPAVTDATSAILQAINGGGAGGGFKELGKDVGDLVKDVVYGLIVDGAKAAEIIAETEVTWRLAMDNMKLTSKATWEGIKGYIKGGIVAAVGAASAAVAADPAGQAAGAQIAAIEKEFEKAKDKANFDVFGGGGGAPPPKPKGDGGAGGTAPALEAASKAKLSLAEKAAQDQLQIEQEFAKQSEQIDKEMYDAGEMSLQEYFGKRRAEVLAETEKEIAIVKLGIDAAKNAAAKAAADRNAATKQGNAQEADKQDAARLNALKEVEELETKIAVLRAESGTKIQALNDEQFKATKQSQQETLAFEKELAQLQGKRGDTAKADIDAQTQKRTLQIAQSGGSDDDRAKLTAELEQWRQLKLAAAAFEDAKDKTKQDTQSFDVQKQGIQIKAKAGQISPLEEEREINDLIKARLPLLQADAAAELGAAQKTGSQDNVAEAQKTVQQMQVIGVQSNKLGEQIGQGLNSDFTTFFETVGRGTQSVAQSFQHLAASVIQSIEQMLIKLLLLKISSAAAGAGGGGGGFLSSVFAGIGGHAEGGLIKGAGGPKDDKVPAMLSHGEFVVKADAVSSFGAHNLDAINRGLKIPSLSQLALPKYAEGGLIGASAGGGDGSISLGIGLDEGLILKHLSSKQAGRIVLNHIANNPKAASKALGRSIG